MSWIDNEVLELGDYCSNVLQDPRFKSVTHVFEQHVMQQLLSTKPEQREERESIYSTFNGLKSFLAHMATMAQDAEANRPVEPIDPETTPIQELPDEIVFDIYREETTSE